jgi:uncharacterized protein (TIGR03118 family)
MRLSACAATIALAAGLLGPPAFAAPFELSDKTLDAVVAGIRFNVTGQVSDQVALNGHPADPNLVNAWGLSQGPGTFLWVANNGTDTSTLYDPASFAKVPLVVNVPGAPTGTTFVGIPNTFNLSGPNTPTLFAFATEGGQIEGWNLNVDLTNAITKVNEAAAGSSFKGLTQAMSSGGPRLYATDFAHGYVSMYDTNFQKVGTFTDPNLPANYTPFNVQALNGLLYVTFARRQPGAEDEDHGQGLGFVDVFSPDGQLIRRLVQHGQLNAPWGLAIAPDSFGKFAGALLVGNFGNGKINAYDPNTGNFIGTLRDEDHSKVAIDGLWALHSGANGTITFSAGPDDETHGLIGSISAASAHMSHSSTMVGMAEMMTMRH